MTAAAESNRRRDRTSAGVELSMPNTASHKTSTPALIEFLLTSLAQPTSTPPVIYGSQFYVRLLRFSDHRLYMPLSWTASTKCTWAGCYESIRFDDHCWGDTFQSLSWPDSNTFSCIHDSAWEPLGCMYYLPVSSSSPSSMDQSSLTMNGHLVLTLSVILFSPMQQ